jgi:hypothetical protein
VERQRVRSGHWWHFTFASGTCNAKDDSRSITVPRRSNGCIFGCPQVNQDWFGDLYPLHLTYTHFPPAVRHAPLRTPGSEAAAALLLASCHVK